MQRWRQIADSLAKAVTGLMVPGSAIMTASAAIRERPQTADEVRLGSFLMGRRLADDAASLAGIVVLEGIGAVETTFAGRAAIIRCLPQKALSADSAPQAKSDFARLRGLRHPAITSILEAGVADGTTFIAEAQPAGVRLTHRIAASTKLRPAQVRRMVADVGGGIAAMHAVGLTHGWISPTNIWVDADGAATLCGFVGVSCGSLSGKTSAVSGQNVLEDQLLLAQSAFTALTGTTFRIDARLPEAVPGIPSGVIAVLARATSSRPADRFPSVATFVRTFDDAMNHAAEDLVAGVWEATSRGDMGMGGIMMAMAEGFAPDHPDLAVLRVRLAGGSLDSQLATQLKDPTDNPFGIVKTAALARPNLRSAEEEAAIAALLTPPVIAPIPSKTNPWLGFMLGTFICVGLLVIALAATFLYL